jgi:hypothetical protein
VSRPIIDLERTGYGDASACLYFVAYPVDDGRLDQPLIKTRAA